MADIASPLNPLFDGPVATSSQIGRPDGTRAETSLQKSDVVAGYYDLNGGGKYYYGKPIVHARVDANNRVGDAIDSDGVHYGIYSIRALGIGFSRGADGWWTLDATQLKLPKYEFPSGEALDGSGGTKYFEGKRVRYALTDINLNAAIVVDETGLVTIPKFYSPGTDPAKFTFGKIAFNTGDSIVASDIRYYSGRRVVSAETDSTGAVSRATLIDGTTVIIKLESPALDLAGGTAALETAAFVYHEIVVGAGKQIRRTSKTSGVRTQATSVGNNFAPRLSFDGAKLVFLTDRTGTRESWYQQLDGSKFGGAVDHPVSPFTMIAGIGDSIMATGWLDPVAAGLGVSLAAPSSSPGGGIGSQRSNQIAARYGAAGFANLPAVTCTLSGNAMAAGANQLTAISNPLLSRSTDAAGTVRTLRCAILGVVGTLTSTQKSAADSTTVPSTQGVDNYTYNFTPDAGQTLPAAVPAGTLLVIDPENRQDCVLVVHLGRNDVGARVGWQDDVKLANAAVYAAYKPFIRRIVMIGVTNQRSEPSGSAVYNQIVALNQETAALYSDSYLDVRPFYNAGEATDIPASANTDDGLHPNNTGKLNGFTIPVRNFIIAKGWYA